jgi:hypothetical protein
MATSKLKKGNNGMAQLNASVPANLKKTIQKMAVDQELTMSDLVAQILQAHVGRSKGPEAKQTN